MRLFKNIIFLYLITSCGLCYAGSEQLKKLAELIRKIDHTSSRNFEEKKEVVEILSEYVSYAILSDLPKTTFNKVVSNLLALNPKNLDAIHSFLSIRDGNSIPRQTDFLMSIYSIPEKHREFVELRVKGTGLLKILLEYRQPWAFQRAVHIDANNTKDFREEPVSSGPKRPETEKDNSADNQRHDYEGKYTDQEDKYYIAKMKLEEGYSDIPDNEIESVFKKYRKYKKAGYSVESMLSAFDLEKQYTTYVRYMIEAKLFSFKMVLAKDKKSLVSLMKRVLYYSCTRTAIDIMNKDINDVVYIFGVDKQYTRYVEYVIRERLFSKEMFLSETPGSFLSAMKKVIYTNLVYIKEESGVDAFVNDLMFLNNFSDDTYRESLKEMFKAGISLRELFYNLDENTLDNYRSAVIKDRSKEALENTEIVEKDPYEESVRTSANIPPHKDYVVRNEKVEPTTVNDKLALYINTINSLSSNKRFQKLTTTGEFVESAINEMAFELFDNGQVGQESLALLSDKQVFNEIANSLHIRASGSEFCRYLYDQVKSIISSLKEEEPHQDWEKGIALLQKQLITEMPKAERVCTTIEIIDQGIEQGLTLSEIIKRTPILFTEDKIIILIHEIKETRSLKLSEEKSRMGQIKAVISAKEDNGDNVETLKNEYDVAEKYLSQEKDLKIFNGRVEKTLGVKDGDIAMAINRLIELEGKLPTEDHVKIFFGTWSRNLRDGLNYQMRAHMQKQGVKTAFSLLYLLILGNNEKITTFNGKVIPVQEFFIRLISNGNKDFVSNIKDLNWKDIAKERLKEDLLPKIMEGTRRLSEIESKLEFK